MSEEILLRLQHAIPIGVFSIIAAGMIALLLHHRKAYREELQRIARELGGTVAGRPVSGRFVRVRTFGSEQRITLTQEGENETPCLGFHQRTELDFSLNIARETAASRLAQKMGLPVEIKVGDPAFDRKYRIKADSREKAIRFLDSSERKQIVDLLFGDGIDSITIRKRDVSFHLAGYTDGDLDAALLRARLEMLLRFVTGAAAPPPGPS